MLKNWAFCLNISIIIMSIYIGVIGEQNKMAKLTITIIRNTQITNKATLMIQKNIFDVLCQKIFIESDNDYSNWTLEQKNDPHKVLEIENTNEYCQLLYDKWVNMQSQTWHSLKTKVRGSKLYRLLPRKKRILQQDSNSKYYDQYLNFLNSIGIYFNVELQKDEEGKETLPVQ